jgi:hypothetical protein
MTPWALALATVAVEPAASELSRTGLYGWGLGFELPAIGVIAGVAEKSTVGWGYTFGGGVSWEVTPTISVRLLVARGRTFDGRARVNYVEEISSEQRASSQQRADWLDLEVALGGAYTWRSVARGWAPYAGADVAFCFSGYDHYFDESPAQLSGSEGADWCLESDCPAQTHSGLESGVGATVRAGLRFDLASWLATLAELSVSYRRVGDEAVANTLAIRDVRTAGESVFLVRTTFSMRLGL